MRTGLRTAFRTCPLCEATCGLAITLDGDRVLAVRGDDADVFSRGYVCPKGVALGELHDDPRRLRQPLVRRDGDHVAVGWDDAFAEVERLLRPVLERHGRDAVGVYLGNPTSHDVAATFYVPALVRALGTRFRFSASTVDQMPKQVAAGLMFGTELSVPIPDVDRTAYLLVLGANPMVSNGSLLTAPDLPGRLRALRRRGGRLVVVDPVRTATARLADEHLPIRPGTDAVLLAGLAAVLFAEGRVDLGPAGRHVVGVEAVRTAVAGFTPDAVAAVTGVPAETVRRLARELAAAESAAVYGRLGTTTAAFAGESYGAVASWLVDVLTTLTGNLDRPGGALWPLPAAGGPHAQGEPGRGRGVRVPGSQRTRVRGLPSVFGELPAVALAEEIDTPGPGGERLRGLVTFAGNPVVSVPGGDRLAAALSGLDVMVSVDAYRNETTRFAHVVLPAPSPLARGHYDVVFANLAVRNVARWSPPSLPLGPDDRDGADVLLRLAALAAGPGVTADQVDDVVAAQLAHRAATDPSSRALGRDPADLLAAVAPRRRVERLLDLALRSGPYGDGFGAYPDGLTLARLEEHRHGVDLGPLQPRLPEVLRTPSGAVELAPEPLLAECARLAERLAGWVADGAPERGLVLVGRRQLRSNNSWLHTLPLLTGGSNRCTLQVHPEDAARFGLADGEPAVLRSASGKVLVPVEVTDVVAPGVVCLPHGWSPDTGGVTSNLLAGTGVVEPLSGTAVLSGIPVEVAPT